MTLQSHFQIRCVTSSRCGREINKITSLQICRIVAMSNGRVMPSGMLLSRPPKGELVWHEAYNAMQSKDKCCIGKCETVNQCLKMLTLFDDLKQPLVLVYLSVWGNSKSFENKKYSKSKANDIYIMFDAAFSSNLLNKHGNIIQHVYYVH